MELFPKLSIVVSVDNEIRCKCVLRVEEVISNHPFEVSNAIKDYTNPKIETSESLKPKQSPELLSKCPLTPTNVLLIKPFINELNKSHEYRLFIYKYFNEKLKKYAKNNPAKKFGLRIIMKASSADSYIIDYAWGWRLWRECHLGLERDLASAWLSTLGGAFSALGDNSTKCAEMALRISLQQVRLSATGGDEDGVARGCLFLALALSQLNHGRSSRVLLRNAFNRPSSDPRHRAMCLGVQAKLKYDSKLRRLARKKRREERLALKAKMSANNQIVHSTEEIANIKENDNGRMITEKNDENLTERNEKENLINENKNALWDLLMSLKL